MASTSLVDKNTTVDTENRSELPMIHVNIFIYKNTNFNVLLLIIDYQIFSLKTRSFL